MYFCRAYTRGLCARCDLSARRPPLFSRSLSGDRDGQARQHETKPNHLHLGHIHRRGVYIPGKNTLTNNTGYEHPRRTAAPGGGGGLSPIPRGVVCGPCARRPGAKFRGHARATLPICDHAPPGPRETVRRRDAFRRGGGARERRRARTTNRAGKRIMTHTQPNARFFRFSGWNPLLINSEFRREISVF